MKRSTVTQALKQLVCIGMVLVVLAPIVLTLFAAFKTKADMVNTSPLLLPPMERITMENFQKVLGDKYLLVGFKNTGIILVVSIFFNVIFGTITAFILERFEFRMKKVILALFFLGMLIPSFVTEIARFKIINGLGLYNTLGAPIVIYVASDLMQLYIYRQFISTIPRSLDESALLDGCSYFGLFGRIILPLLAPATATVIIIKAITIINDMYIPYLYMPKNKLRTLTTFLMNFANAQQGSWQKLAAGIIVIMLPTIVIYVFFQKYILAGVAAGAVKE
ncbi:MAG: carbohydrate ABC transporter permease [Lachnospiraceae bacterium]|jgi:multiple sugar transport system permease protein|nr:carbohydrate ABC transporter permease [Lachnospiraceae bacterium]